MSTFNRGYSVVGAPVRPLHEEDTFPVCEETYFGGGYRSIASLVARDLIPAARRTEGMLVYVRADGMRYRLMADLVSWTVDSAGGTGAGSVSVNTIALLRAVTTNQPTWIKVLGYYAKGDGGGGDFLWDGSSTATDDGGYVIQPTAVATGRFRRIQSDDIVNVRYFGGIEGQTTAVQSAAFNSCWTYCSNNYAKALRISAVGTFTFDPTLFSYSADKWGRLGGGATTGAQTLLLGGDITFTTPFYHPRQWTVRGVGGGNYPQFTNGVGANIIGDYVCRATGARMENLYINGQLLLDGHTGTGISFGQDAGVYMDNVSVSIVSSARALTVPTLHVINKYEIWANNCVFLSSGPLGTEPTCAIKFLSNFECGLTRIMNSFVAGGNIQIDTSANSNFDSDFYFNLLHEGLNQPYLFDVTGGKVNLVEFDEVSIADPQSGSAQFLRVNSGSMTSVIVRKSVGLPFTGTGLEKIRHLMVEGFQRFIEYSTVDLTLASWRNTQSYRNGDFASQVPSVLGKNCVPGFVKPAYLCVRNAPITNGFTTWTPVASGGFDGIGTSYSAATAPVSDAHHLSAQSFATPALSVGDVFILSLWGKRNESLNVLPSIALSLINTSGGAAAVDGFSGSTTPSNLPLLARFAGYTWWYGYCAIKIQIAGTYYVNAALSGLNGNVSPFVISDVGFIQATGNLTAYEVYELAMANMRFPSLIVSGSSNYYSWAPGAAHALRDDVAILSSQAKVAGVLAGNAWYAGSGATGSRPTGITIEGVQWFDTTLHKPIWTTTVLNQWKDSAGTVV